MADAAIIRERLANLRSLMREKQVDYLLVCSSDYHSSEYVGEYFKEREYITGFAGSAGTAVIGLEEAGLWTDGRYFIAAEAVLRDTGIELYRMGEEGVPTPEEFLASRLSQGKTLAADGRTLSASEGEGLRRLAKGKKASFLTSEDIIGEIWTDRPPFPAHPAYSLPIEYTGQSRKDKLFRLRETMRKKNTGLHLLSSLCDIAWLLNIRGEDIGQVPVVYSHLLVSFSDCVWYVSPEAVDDPLREELLQDGITLAPYDAFYEDAALRGRGQRILLDLSNINERLLSSLPDNAIRVVSSNPSLLWKAMKNPVEQENARRVHLRDGLAVTRFILWLKKHCGNAGELITEISAAKKLESFRKEQENYLSPSFGTIAAYGAHGAIVHYGATPESDIPLQPEGFFLVDSGGHYAEGSTDITRTIALGPLTREMKEDYTRVLQGNLRLAEAVFLYGVNGLQLDILARSPLWAVGMDFKHGTGHGVGNRLSVHEGPNAFRWRMTQGRSECTPLEEGMITSDEPGLYWEGRYGIRTENELLCRKGIKNEFGQFMCFEVLTLVPFDREAILPEMLSREELAALNRYHRRVEEALVPLLSPEEANALKELTSEIRAI